MAARQGAVTAALDHIRKLAGALISPSPAPPASQKLASASIGWLNRALANDRHQKASEHAKDKI
ncbi:MAG TPA: hypothetical protein VK829_08100 [Terriglobales bacterium]|nr:hypothetical protein [Terriglobales bacterium]